MSITGSLAAIATGGTPPQLLHACRLEVGGFDAFGVEAVSDAFRRDPMDVGTATVCEDAAHFAAVGEGQGIFADLYDGHVGRLWRAGRPAPHAPEPFVAVPFDPDLRQARGDVEFAAGDHPNLAADVVACVRSAGLQIIAHDTTAWRSRAFCIRAFGDVRRGAALFALYRMSGERVRASGFGYAVALWDGAETTLAVDAVPHPGNGRVRIVG